MKQLPMGFRDYLPEDIKKRDHLIDCMTTVVKQRQYQRIITPVLENFNFLEKGLGALANDCIRFYDGAGTPLVLRPDHTTSIARIASTRLLDAMPIKLYYHDPVFRKDPLLGETEIFQFGCEQVGEISQKEEVQMIRMVHDICAAVGLNDIEIHVSHPQLYANMTTHHREALRKGEVHLLPEIPRKGGADLAEKSPDLLALLTQLVDVGMTNVFVNVGLFKDDSTYNGVFFDVVSRSFGKVIGSGGRYDSVLRAFNCTSNAFGFSLRLHYLEQALCRQTP